MTISRVMSNLRIAFNSLGHIVILDIDGY
jgi:hypothetical protein